MTAPTERQLRYAEALHPGASHADWWGADVASVMNVADAEQAELRARAKSAEAEVARLTRLLEQRTAALTRTIDAKNTADAKVARVEALVGRWSCGRCDDYMVFCHEGCGYADDLRATLDGGRP